MKHVLDGPRARGQSRLKRFLRTDRGASLRRQAEVLQRLPRRLNGSQRLKRYLGIARVGR